ncbi:hypothetical protein GCM10007111_39390 [Virgibacillus kapii]|uniref:Uncharacterized protein n=1 Tax=Virgibacillus kapii TaxID=1638645 RepID=A0ABQ2DUJ5_9BACI|nr:hypothetical protein M948_17145 [Virgibacillus sp. CM-4]GGJ73892.1 hypothetical protein GCM10007111_39390 [Virgibacillus kapii]
MKLKNKIALHPHTCLVYEVFLINYAFKQFTCRGYHELLSGLNRLEIFL